MFIINKETLLATVDSGTCLTKQQQISGHVSNLAVSPSHILSYLLENSNYFR
jgi:hypothetical protein